MERKRYSKMKKEKEGEREGDVEIGKKVRER